MASLSHRHPFSNQAGSLSANSSDTLLALFGGVAKPEAADASPMVDDGMWLYSMRRRAWLRLHMPAGSRRPSARLGHTLLSVAPGTLWLYGGLSPTAHARPPLGSPPSRHTAAGDSAQLAWRFSLPEPMEEVLDACDGCSAHGACDVLGRRCVCDVGWGGERCDGPQLAKVAEAPRRAIVLALWLSGSMVVGGVLGWLWRQRALRRELERRKREMAREQARANPHSSAAASTGTAKTAVGV
jgi:hypothetical protein